MGLRNEDPKENIERNERPKPPFTLAIEETSSSRNNDAPRLEIDGKGRFTDERKVVTERQTDRPTVTPSYRDAWTHLKILSLCVRTSYVRCWQAWRINLHNIL